MATAVEERAQLIKDNARKEGDSGSPEVQVALLTQRIAEVSDHLRTHQHDHAARHGLVLMVGKRNRQLKYLARVNPSGYHGLIKRLGLRK